MTTTQNVLLILGIVVVALLILMATDYEDSQEVLKRREALRRQMLRDQLRDARYNPHEW
jgi:hypothetical protein